MRHRIPVTILITLVAASLCFAADEDPYLWMEEVENEKTLAWAKQRAQADTAVFEAVPEFTEIHGTLLEIYNSRDRIPVPEVRGSWIYNFWQDAEHVRGVWRRTFLSEFVKDDAAWEIVFDLDALAEAEGENWVWKGADCLAPAYRQCMISLSRGGADATVEREFDTVAKAFVDGGFALSEAKHRIDWMDESTLWVGTDFGEGSLTSSGYPRFAKKWQRGTPIEEAVTIFEASVDDVFAIAYSDHTKDDRYDLVNLTPEFFRGTNYLRLGGRLVARPTRKMPSWRSISTDSFRAAAHSKCFSSPARGSPSTRSSRPGITSCTPRSIMSAAGCTVWPREKSGGRRRRSSCPASAPFASASAASAAASSPTPPMRSSSPTPISSRRRACTSSMTRGARHR
jgi:hypothetical protein